MGWVMWHVKTSTLRVFRCFPSRPRDPSFSHRHVSSGWPIVQRHELILSLPRVINFNFPLQPHQKYLKYGYTTNFHYITSPFLFERLEDCTFWTRESDHVWYANKAVSALPPFQLQIIFLSFSCKQLSPFQLQTNFSLSVANKWIHEYGNEFTTPCTLRPDEWEQEPSFYFIRLSRWIRSFRQVCGRHAIETKFEAEKRPSLKGRQSDRTLWDFLVNSQG